MTETIPGLSDARSALLAKYLRGELPRSATAPPGIPRRPPVERIPLSFGQQQIWLLTQMAPDRPVYNECATLRLTGPLDVAVLEESFTEVIRRHEAWRTTFSTADGEPYQVIHPPSPISLPVTDLAALPAEQREAEALRLATADARVPFDLTQGPLFRPRLVRFDDYEHRLYVTLHHIIFDVVSIYQVLLPELAAIYAAFIAGESAPLPEPALQYADYAVWQRERLREDALAGHLTWWRRYLGDAAVLQLPTDHPRPPVQTFRGAVQRLALPKPLSDALKDLSRREGATLYMTLMAAFVTLLHHYAGQDDIVIGTIIGARGRPEIEKLMGYFLNTLALRLDLTGNPTFRALLKRVRGANLAAHAHREAPFERVVQELHPQRTFTQNPLFQVYFTLEPPHAPLDVPWSAGVLGGDVGTAKVDLSVELEDGADGIIGRFQYSTDLFEPETIARMIGQYETLLRGIVADPDQSLADLPIFTDAERQQILVAWNATDTDYPRDRHIHELFAEQAARAPDAIAAICEGEQITYRALDRRANQLAHHLQARGVGPETLVGICLDRSLEMIVGVLAVLKAGGAYVPLDPTYPRDRLAFMLEDANARVLITDRRLAAELPVRDTAVICLDRDREAIARHATEAPASAATPENLAYVIYTSGSTGKPKGVMISRRALMNFIWDMRGKLDVSPSDVLMAVASFSFDMVGLDLFLPLIAGARIVIVPRDVAKHSRRLAALIDRSDGTMLQATPTAWRSLLESGWRGNPRLHILSGGEALPRSLAQRLLPAGKRVTNLYGPTETTIYSAVYPVEDAEKPISLGRPIANTRIYLLDRHHQPVPIGVPGEVFIGGDGVARGYLNRPELTAERFIPDPFATDPSARLYATGDLARYQHDGTLEFLGRGDHQVKVRGFRIELGEIETLLERRPDVRQAVVMAREDIPGNASLAAYIVPAQLPTPTANELRQALSAQLPDYMVPSAFVLLDALPMTPNGKVDRKALPAPRAVESDRETTFVAPTGLLQLQLARIWEELLDMRPIGVTDDFFALGGTSLLAARLVDRIADVCGQTVPLATLFAGATIEHLEEAILQQKSDEPRSRVVRVQEGNGKRPFFFLHGDLRDGGLYSVKLARALDPDRPFYAIHPTGTDGGPVPHTFEALAADHRAALQAIQPEGPYLLGGYCNGAYVAFEIARQLEAQGQQVDALVMIEQGTAYPEIRVATVLIGLWSKLTRLGPEEQIRLYLRLRDSYTQQLPRLISPDRMKIIATIDATMRKNLERLGNAVSRGGKRIQLPSLIPRSYADDACSRRAFELEYRYMWASNRYLPRRYRGRVALFQAADEHAAAMHDPTQGWKEILENMEIFFTPGGHFSAITTHVEPLAKQIRTWLGAVEEARAGRDATGDG